jgi:cytosine permease
MAHSSLISTMEDHALERVPDAQRENWLAISWNTAGLVTTLVIMFFGALVCFVAGTRIALLAGIASFGIGTALAWPLARITYETGFSNTLITRRYGLGVRGSALASLIFGFLIVGFLAVENGLLYRGFLFYLTMQDDWPARVLLYGGMTIAWILLTAFGFAVLTRVSSLMLIGFLAALAWMLLQIPGQAGGSLADALLFGSQLEPAALARMGVESDFDKFAFALNILAGPACALALNTADFGRYGRSTAHIGAAATIAIFLQSLLMMIIGGALMKSAAPAMIEYFSAANGLSAAAARHQILRSPDSIAATFMVLGGGGGFVLMLLAQAKAQVLNTYSSSLCITNLFDALFRWRPGRITFVVLANVIALLMLYGQILHIVEEWIKLLGVLLSALAGVIVMDYYVVAPRLREPPGQEGGPVNWAGVLTIIGAVLFAHVLLKPYFPVEVLSSLGCVAVLYPLLRLTVFRPALRSDAARFPTSGH